MLVAGSRLKFTPVPKNKARQHEVTWLLGSLSRTAIIENQVPFTASPSSSDTRTYNIGRLGFVKQIEKL